MMEDDSENESAETSSTPISGSEWDVSALPRVDLADIVANYDPISVGNERGREFIVVAPRESALGGLTDGDTGIRLAMRDQGLPQEPRQPKQRMGMGANTGEIRPHDQVDIAHGIGVAGDSDMSSELGSAVASPWTSWTRREYNQDLVGYKGLRIYDKMRRSDGTVRGTLRLAKTPVLAAKWGMNPASDGPRDRRIANFVWNNLTSWGSTSWPQFITESLLMLDFGYYMFEKVFAHGEDVTADKRAAGRIAWKKFAPRHPMDVKEWFFDINGGPLSVDMWAPPAVGVPTFEGGTIQAFQRWINIPINKLVVFTFDKEAGNIEGISLLRSAYKHFYYKDALYKIDAIQKERHGIGIPIICLPMGYSPNDKKLADQLGRNLRTNDRAHVVLPPNWTLSFAELKGHPVDCMNSIKHHDDMIPQSMLGRFMNSPGGTSVEEQHTLFLKATRFLADIVVDIMNSYAIPQLCQLNWGATTYPQLYAKNIGEQEDWRTESFAIRNYVGAGVIVPDDPLEDAVRDRMGLPKREDASARIVKETPMENEQRINPPEGTQLPGPGHQTVPADMPIPKVDQPAYQQKRQQSLQPLPNAASQAARPQGPRLRPPKTISPGVGKGDRSGNSNRRGQ